MAVNVAKGARKKPYTSFSMNASNATSGHVTANKWEDRKERGGGEQRGSNEQGGRKREQMGERKNAYLAVWGNRKEKKWAGLAESELEKGGETLQIVG